MSKKANINQIQFFTVHSHPWAKHMPGISDVLNETMHAMWKFVFHNEHGECYQFNSYDQGMPNITLGKDEKRILFKALPGKSDLVMLVHNQFDFQDAQVLYGKEKIMRKGERK